MSGEYPNLNHELTREEKVRGGKKSGVVRNEKKLIVDILREFLEKDVKSVSALKKYAKSIGIKGTENIKTLVTIALLLNSLNKGDINDLVKLATFLGENSESVDILDKLDKVLEGIESEF